MKNWVVSGTLVVIVLLASMVSVFAQEEPEVYYVRQGHEGCQDGSQECPYSTRFDAIEAGNAEVCEERTYEIWQWNTSTGMYEYYDTYTGAKPLPGTGVPIAWPLVILLVAAAGAFLLYIAWRLRRQTAS